ncbi:MAG TPA: hypothetical protein PKC58_17800 [Ignavibacteria bacterium]|nr:hypothetical protein [Ignavibacteria bacterium]
MMKVLCLNILLFFCSCSQTSNNKVITSDVINNDVLKDGISDTLVQHVFKQGSKGNQLVEIQPKPNIEFSSGESGEVSFYKYQFKYEGFQYELIAEHHSIADRSIYIDKNKARVIRKNSPNFNIDSLNLNIDYSESYLYGFKSNPTYLLVVSKPMNWVGTMTRFSFFQLINSKEKTVIEFIIEEE